MVELPVAAFIQSDQVAGGVNFGKSCGGREVAEVANMAYVHM